MNRITIATTLDDMMEDFQYLHKMSELVKNVLDESNSDKLNEFEVGKLHDLIKTIHAKQKEIDEDIITLQTEMGYKLI